ncbi:MAG TPA: hypothetical protein VGH53_02560 [Streptosporangiaceae bacterium]
MARMLKRNRLVLAGLRPGDTMTVSWVGPSGRHVTGSLRLPGGPPE